MNIKLLIFRHGETDWNAQRKFQGHTDIPLNATGEKQAEALRAKLARYNKIKTVLCSDLKRARRTAEIATSELKVPPFVISSDLREIHLGEAESLTQQEIEQKFGIDMISKWRSIAPEDHDYCFPGGEVKSKHLLRLQNYLHQYLDSQKHTLQENDEIAVSTHGGCVIRLVHACANAPQAAIAIPNCVLYEIHYNLATREWKLIGEVV